jgi:cell division septation protein DedD
MHDQRRQVVEQVRIVTSTSSGAPLVPSVNPVNTLRANASDDVSVSSAQRANAPSVTARPVAVPATRRTDHPVRAAASAAARAKRVLPTPAAPATDHALVFATSERLADEAEFLRAARQGPAVCHGANVG